MPLSTAVLLTVVLSAILTLFSVLPFGAGAGAVCGTDAQCAAYSRSIGEVPSGYAAGH